MFGRYTFSKAPFAGQGANAYILSLTEDASVTDTATATGVFPFSFDEPMTMEDTNAEHAVFYFGNVDDMYTAQDTIDSDVNYPVSFSDGVSCEETIGITAQFAGSVDEALLSLDEYIGGVVVLFTITEDFTSEFSANNELVTDFSITETLTTASTQTITAQFAVSRSEVFAVETHLEEHGWIKIVTNTDPNWTPIQDAQ